MKLTTSQNNITFLPNCRFDLIDGISIGKWGPRKAGNAAIKWRNLISFDLDFKDLRKNFNPSPASDQKEWEAKVIHAILDGAQKYKIPLWIANFSGHGLHLHFKLSKPIDTSNATSYQRSYHLWCDLLEGVIGNDIRFDRSCSNVARLMRLPGSINWKNAKNPIKGAVLFHNPQADAASFFNSVWEISKDKGRQAVDLKDILSEFGYQKMESITTVGSQIRCSSPFGNDTTPSFFFHPIRQIYYDFSTGYGGSVYHLVAKLSHLDPDKDRKEISFKLRKIRGEHITPQQEKKYNLRPDGVWFIRPVQDDEESIWICSPLEVKAMTRATDGDSWGRILRFFDDDQRVKTWAMPMELLAGDGLELRKELMRRGLRISTNRSARTHLMEYIQSQSVEDRMNCVNRIGWHGSAFILPNESFSSDHEKTNHIFQGTGDFTAISVSGSLTEWQQNVAIPASDHSRLLFAISAAFCPPLIYLRNEESGGIHLVGSSSIGKTLALRVAGSVWGGGGISGYLSKWRATVNGLESMAESRCDSLLLLDELSEISPKDAARATYMLANGSGKKRLDRNGSPLPSREWRTLFLSSGEISLATHIDEAGESSRGGHSVRLVEIEADAGHGHGVLDTEPKDQSSRSFVEQLRLATASSYGTPIRTFLRYLCSCKNITDMISKYIDQFMDAISADKLPRQVARTANRFALIFAAGALACKFKILPCEIDQLLLSVRQCFDNWASSRLADPDFETTKILSQIRGFLQANGQSQFLSLNHSSFTQNTSGKLAGFKQCLETGEIEWFVLNEVFRKELCQGLEIRKVLSTLRNTDHLAPSKDGKSSKTMRLPGIGCTRVYHLRSSILA
ncbi:MAG: DUF927 domain-containing protein [Deltaproteobacteria bacterium]|nr:DUF927 domain-containing protein [Deltaproteobacteria bacterium]